MAKPRVITCAKVILIISNVIFMFFGMWMILCGIWLHVDRSVVVTLNVFHTSPHGPIVHAITHTLIACGLCVAVLAFLGCCGASCESVCMLVSYTTILAMIIFTEAIGATLISLLNDKLVKNIEARMYRQIYEEYNRTENTTYDITMAWDLMQVKLNCCGARGPQDYSQSYWYNNTQIEGTFVPTTCCVLLNDDPVYPHVYAENQCQIDSILYPKDLNTSIAVHTRGCHPVLMEWMSDKVMYAIIAASAIGALQVLVLLFACCLFSRMRSEQTKYPWYNMVAQ